METMDEAVRLALQRPLQGDAVPAAQLLRVPDETLHRLREAHELRRAQALQRAVLLEEETKTWSTKAVSSGISTR